MKVFYIFFCYYDALHNLLDARDIKAMPIANKLTCRISRYPTIE